MDWEPAHGTIIAATSRTGHPQRHQQRAKWVDYNEIGRRRSEGSCLRCGNQGHMIKSCPLLPAQHPNYQRQQNQLTMRKPQVAATASPRRKITPEIAASDIEESGTDDDSGKE
ncbi:hypothetical protein BJ878DRAFT_431466 [Calycina marina]|uniref:CCHC-type domain-containing protein n=1 Tax=Calycina marina TaxID=1763456 RepID=A0A9P7YVH8_9HELO|nr:hypothetical protein BJ878DRAFT_431466 [Calycina marina]